MTPQQEKASIEMFLEYIDYIDIFSLDLITKLPENTGINKYVIKLVEDKQPLYELIYDLGLVILKTLETYIIIYLKTGFIRPSKFFKGALILFDKKPNKSIQLCVNY